MIVHLIYKNNDKIIDFDNRMYKKNSNENKNEKFIPKMFIIITVLKCNA